MFILGQEIPGIRVSTIKLVTEGGRVLSPEETLKKLSIVESGKYVQIEKGCTVANARDYGDGIDVLGCIHITEDNVDEIIQTSTLIVAFKLSDGGYHRVIGNDSHDTVELEGNKLRYINMQCMMDSGSEGIFFKEVICLTKEDILNLLEKEKEAKKGREKLLEHFKSTIGIYLDEKEA